MDLQQVMRDAVAPRPKVARPIVLIGAGGLRMMRICRLMRRLGFLWRRWWT